MPPPHWDTNGKKKKKSLLNGKMDIEGSWEGGDLRQSLVQIIKGHGEVVLGSMSVPAGASARFSAPSGPWPQVPCCSGAAGRVRVPCALAWPPWDLEAAPDFRRWSHVARWVAHRCHFVPPKYFDDSESKKYKFH